MGAFMRETQRQKSLEEERFSQKEIGKKEKRKKEEVIIINIYL